MLYFNTNVGAPLTRISRYDPSPDSGAAREFGRSREWGRLWSSWPRGIRIRRQQADSP